MILNVVSVVVFILIAGIGPRADDRHRIADVGGPWPRSSACSPPCRLAWRSSGSAPSCCGSDGSSACRGPGLFWIIPFVDVVARSIDQRMITTAFAAEQTLTSDTVPVNVDAVLFWVVHDPERAALEVQNYPVAVSWAAQTALRDIIGRTSLADLLRGREKIEHELQQIIDARSTPWGVTVQAVEMRDIVIPSQLQEAMSREAQAAREKQARIILGEAEMEIAHSFEVAARVYKDNPTALHLRAMNMLYEGLKEKGALMLVPSTAVESMGMGGMLGAAALQQARLGGRWRAEMRPAIVTCRSCWHRARRSSHNRRRLSAASTSSRSSRANRALRTGCRASALDASSSSTRR